MSQEITHFLRSYLALYLKGGAVRWVTCKKVQLPRFVHFDGVEVNVRLMPQLNWQVYKVLSTLDHFGPVQRMHLSVQGHHLSGLVGMYVLHWPWERSVGPLKLLSPLMHTQLTKIELTLYRCKSGADSVNLDWVHSLWALEWCKQTLSVVAFSWLVCPEEGWSIEKGSWVPILLATFFWSSHLAWDFLTFFVIDHCVQTMIFPSTRHYNNYIINKIKWKTLSQEHDII